MILLDGAGSTEEDKMSDKGQQIVDDLRAQGYSDEQIKDALCDGEYLSTTDYTQDEIEDAYAVVKKPAQTIK